MKVKIVMAALVVTLMLGVRGYANPCDAACVDPCGSCDRFVERGGDLFSGLKRLVSGVRTANNCDPCDPVVACNPCDEVACNPCDVACEPRLGLGSRLRNLLAAPSYSNCNDFDCSPCDLVANCDPCGEANFCASPKFSFRNLNLFSGLRLNLNRGCFDECSPCDAACGPCDAACGPCDAACGPCDAACGPCDEVCGDSCGPRGHLFDLPRFNLSKLFNNLRVNRCAVANCAPCDVVGPCDGACCR